MSIQKIQLFSLRILIFGSLLWKHDNPYYHNFHQMMKGCWGLIVNIPHLPYEGPLLHKWNILHHFVNDKGASSLVITVSFYVPYQNDRTQRMNSKSKKMLEKYFLFLRIYGILFTKLFWPTVKKICSSEQQIFLKFDTEGREFAKFLRSLDQFFRKVKGENNFWSRMFFLTSWSSQI